MTRGELFIVTIGEYSDYGIFTTCLVLQDFDWDVLSAEHKGHVCDLIARLVAQGLIREFPMLEIHSHDRDDGINLASSGCTSVNPHAERHAREKLERARSGKGGFLGLGKGDTCPFCKRIDGIHAMGCPIA